MTHPQDPQDPFGSSTRRFDPEEPTSAYSPEQYPGTSRYGAGQYGTGQYGTSQYGAGQYGTQTYGQEPGGGGNKRTKILIGSILAALVAILLVAFLISVAGGRGGEQSGPTSVPTPVQTSEESTTSATSTTESSPTSETSAPASPGQVVYRLVGDGDLIVVRYTDTTGGFTTLATTRSPWSVTMRVPGGQAAINGIVVRGTVTCQIVVGGTVVSEGSSSGGPLSCSADVPE